MCGSLRSRLIDGWPVDDVGNRISPHVSHAAAFLSHLKAVGHRGLWKQWRLLFQGAIGAVRRT